MMIAPQLRSSLLSIYAFSVRKDGLNTEFRNTCIENQIVALNLIPLEDGLNTGW